MYFIQPKILTYSEIRADIKDGDLLGFGHSEFKDFEDAQVQLVMAATKSPLAHVAAAARWGQNVFVIEAVVPQVRPWPLSLMGDFYWVPMTENGFSQKTMDLLVSKIGHPYSKKEAVKAFFGHNTKGDDPTECAELYREAGIAEGVLPDGIDTPAKVFYDAQASGRPMYLVKNPINN